jgi:hypothetical protein
MDIVRDLWCILRPPIETVKERLIGQAQAQTHGAAKRAVDYLGRVV